MMHLIITFFLFPVFFFYGSQGLVEFVVKLVDLSFCLLIFSWWY